MWGPGFRKNLIFYIYNITYHIMKEAIEKVIKEEEISKANIEEARKKCEDIKKEADEKADEIVQQAIKEAQAEADKIVEKARKEAESEKIRRLEKAEKDNSSNVSEEKIDKTAEKLFKMFIKVD